MKALFPMAIAAILTTSPSAAVELEQKAVIDQDDLVMARAIGDMLDTTGYDCKSVSHFRPLFLKPGFKIQCNQFARVYIITRSTNGETMWDIEVER